MSNEAVNNKGTFNQSTSKTPIYLARNWWILIVVIIVTVSMGFFGIWLITNQAIQATRLGREIPGGWSWMSIIAFDCLIIFFVLAIVRDPWKQLRMEFTSEGIRYISLLGRKTLAWNAVTSAGVVWINGFKRIEIRSGKQRLIIIPLYYKDMNKLFDIINEHLSVDNESKGF